MQYIKSDHIYVPCIYDKCIIHIYIATLQFAARNQNLLQHDSYEVKINCEANYK